MNKKDKLQSLLNKLNSLQTPTNIDTLIEKEVADFSSKLSESPTIKILQNFSKELNSLKSELNFEPIISAMKELETELESNQNDLVTDFKSRLEEIRGSIPILPEPTLPFDSTSLEDKISSLRKEFLDKQDFDDKPLKKEIKGIRDELKNYSLKSDDEKEDKQVALDLEKKLAKLRTEMNNRIGALGGGSMNRQIYINGVDPLTRYTDINLKAGSNVTINYANNNTTKKVDITFIATGGGGGGGIARSINSVSTPTNAGNASATDYVYLCSGTMTLTLPDATSGNTNLYTIKNVGTGVVTVNTTSSQTIDGSLTAVLTVQYTSIDVESDTANWNVT